MVAVGVATIPIRLEQVKMTIQSLLPQVDRIYVSLNGFNPTPGELMAMVVNNGEKINASFTDGSDEQKFRALSENEAGEITTFLTVDDDLILPPDYVKVIKDRLEHYDIVTFHGRNFNSFPIKSYYKSAGSKYRCLDKVSTDVPVMVGGTGCMAFRPANFSVSLADFPSKYMADVHLAIAAKKQGKRIMCIAHEAGWIKYQPVSDTIYDRFRDDDKEQTERINEIFSAYAHR